MGSFANIGGHKNAKKLLSAALKNGKIAHSYLFVGAANLGKFLMAKEFAKSLSCRNGFSGNSCGECAKCLAIDRETDPDVLFINSPDGKFSDERREEKKSISVEEIRLLQHHLSLFPYDSKYKIAIVNEAHKFTAEAINAFLKTLEEPKGNSIIILVADNSKFLLKTLISRTQAIRFWPLKNEVIENLLIGRGASLAKAKEISAISSGKPGLAIGFLEDPRKIADYCEKEYNFWSFVQANLSGKMIFLESLFKKEEDVKDILQLWMLYARKRILRDYLPENFYNNGARGASSDDFPKVELKKLVNFVDNLAIVSNLIDSSNINKRLALEILALEI